MFAGRLMLAQPKPMQRLAESFLQVSTRSTARRRRGRFRRKRRNARVLGGALLGRVRLVRLARWIDVADHFPSEGAQAGARWTSGDGVVTTDDVRRDEGDLSPTPRCVADQLRERDAGQSPLERRDQLQTAIERGSKV